MKPVTIASDNIGPSMPSVNIILAGRIAAGGTRLLRRCQQRLEKRDFGSSLLFVPRAQFLEKFSSALRRRSLFVPATLQIICDCFRAAATSFACCLSVW